MLINHISYLDLSVCLVVMAIPFFISRFMQLDLERDLMVGTIRVFIQLVVIGYVLDEIFAINQPLPVFIILLTMTVIAGYNAAQRSEIQHQRMVIIATGVIGLTSFALCAWVFFLVVGIEPYFNPRYVIPMSGMGLNGAMSAVAIGARALERGMRDGRDRIEASLCVGATSWQASLPIVRDALKQAMIPTINGLMTAGIVQLPGFMTGAIISGVDPIMAVRYQVMIFYLLTSITATSAILAILMLAQHYFTPNHQLVNRAF